MKLTPARLRMLEVIRDQDMTRLYESRQWRRILTELNRQGLIQWAVDLPTGRELTTQGKAQLVIEEFRRA